MSSDDVLMAYDDATLTDLSQTIFVRSNTHPQTTYTHIRTQILTNATGKSAMRCISLKIRL